MAETPITLTGWQSYYAEPGAVFALSYLCPPEHICRDDKRVFDMITARRGVADLPLIARSGIDATIPRAGFQRVGSVLVVWIGIATGGTLGTLLPGTVKPCAGNNAGYTLQAVNRFRVRGNWLQIADLKVQDTLERNPGEVIGQTAAGGVQVVTNTVVQGLLPVLFPVAIGLYLVARYRK